jgi:hypothetical protein
VPEKMVINGSVGGGKTQTRSESVLELLAHKFGVGFFGFHDEIREMEFEELKVESSKLKVKEKERI